MNTEERNRDAGRNIILSLALHFMVLAIISGGHIRGTSMIRPPGIISVSLETGPPGKPAAPDRPDQLKTASADLSAAAAKRKEPVAARLPARISPPVVAPPVNAPPKVDRPFNPGVEAGGTAASTTASGQAAGLPAGTSPAPVAGASTKGRGGEGVSLLPSSGQGTGNGAESSDRQRTGPDVLSVIRASIYRAKYYPFMAKKKEIEGTATVEFTINGRGYPENIRIVKGSGSDILDSAAKETITRAAPFAPLNGAIRVPIVYRLEKE